MRLCRPPCAICHRRRRARNHAFPVIPAFISRHRGKLPPQFAQDAFCLCLRGPYPRGFSGVGTRSARRDCRASDYPSSTAAPASTSTPRRQPRTRPRHQLQVDSLELGPAINSKSTASSSAPRQHLSKFNRGAGLNFNSKSTPATGPPSTPSRQPRTRPRAASSSAAGAAPNTPRRRGHLIVSHVCMLGF